MRLCDLKGRFLFEADPNWQIANGEWRMANGVTSEEIFAWGAYYEMERK